MCFDNPRREALFFQLKVSFNSGNFPMLCNWAGNSSAASWLHTEGKDNNSNSSCCNSSPSVYGNVALLCSKKILCQTSLVNLRNKEKKKKGIYQTYPVHSLIYQVFSAHLCKFWRGRTEIAHHSHFFYCHKYHNIYRGDCSTLSSKGYQCQTVGKIPHAP